MKMTQEIRRADPNDLDFLRRHDRHLTDAALRKAVEDGRVSMLGGPGAVKGWLRWTLFWDEYPFLNMIYLLDEHRDNGLGTRFLDAWESEMRTAGYSRVLTSTASNERSQQWYRRQGYHDAGVLLLPSVVAELLMSKELIRAS